MARSPVNLFIPGTCTITRPNGNFVATNTGTEKRVSETCSGTTRRKPKGWMTPTSYRFEKFNIDYQRGVCINAPFGDDSSTGQVYSGGVGISGAGRFNGNDHFDEALLYANAKVDPGLVNRALIKARNNLKSTNINVGIAWAERSRTARLVGDTASNIGKAFNQLKRGNVRRAMRQLGIDSRKDEPRGNSVPKKWLELQYGWKPLLSDVFGACEELSKSPKHDWRVTAKGRIQQTDVYTAKQNLVDGVVFDGWNVTARLQRSAYVRIDALPENEALISLASIGVTNPLLVAWELVPYSFVVDWLVPVGGWLESLDAMLGYGSAYTSSSFLARANWDDNFSQRIKKSSAEDGYQECRFTGSKRMIYLDRSVSTGVPLPSFPGIKDPFSFGHMANGLALLSQAFGRR